METRPETLLALDQGTTSTRAVLFDLAGTPLSQAHIELPQHYPQAGWVEHDPEDLRAHSLHVLHTVLVQSPQPPRAIGITNQRETTVVWDKRTGKAIYPAIVWQDRRTAAWCQQHQAFEATVRAKTGLLLDPYFSASKIAWILDNVAGARAQAEAGGLAFGTVDTWLIWHLTGQHATDASNASRTALFNIHTQAWDEDLLRFFNVPAAMLPSVKDSADDFGCYQGIPVRGVAGDQQAATVGQGCFQAGQVKSTYGTGAFMVANTGAVCVESKHRLLSTVAYRLNGHVTYALEGSIFMAGAILHWLRDVGLIGHASESERLVASLPHTEGVVLVPAFVGLGAPYWDSEARAALVGLTRGTTRAHIVRAGLEAVSYQTLDLLNAMRADGVNIDQLKVDGGMVSNAWWLQHLSDTLAVPVLKSTVAETTAWGAALLAGLGAGCFETLPAAAPASGYQPLNQLSGDYQHWLRAVARVR